MSKAEEFIEKYTKNCSNIDYTKGVYPPSYQSWITPDEARKAVEIAREEIYEWLKENAYKYSTVGLYTDAMITDLNQTIKDE